MRACLVTNVGLNYWAFGVRELRGYERPGLAGAE